MIAGARRRWLTLSVAFTTCAISLTMSASSATASGGGDGCNPSRSNNYLTYYWIGAESQNVDGTPGGVYASIRTYSPFVAGPNQGAPSGDNVSEWVMLDNINTPPNIDEWSQIGWVEYPGGTRFTFIQAGDSSGNLYTDFYGPSPINSTQTYSSLYQPGAQLPFVLQENGSTLDSYNLGWAPNDSRIFAELHTQASQVPGGTADPPGQVAQVNNAHIWPTAGSGGWENFDGYTLATSNPSSNMSFMGISPALNTSGVNAWRTWDKACTE